MSFKKFSFITFFLVIFFNLKVYGYPYCPTNKNTTLKSSPSAMGEAVVHVPENYFLQVTARVDSYYVVKYDDKTLFISKDDMGYADILEKKYNPIDKNYELLSEYKTTFDPTEYTRVHNIELASYKTSGELASGAIFSFNTLTGNSNLPANGWQPAEVIESGKKAVGYGGGICQVASTINCTIIKLDGIEEIERRLHSIPMHYVPRNDEAMVDYGNSDFVFKNTYPFKIYINNSVDAKNGLLITQIYKVGDESEKSFVNQTIEKNSDDDSEEFEKDFFKSFMVSVMAGKQ